MLFFWLFCFTSSSGWWLSWWWDIFMYSYI
jgi:hypothetical protein